VRITDFNAENKHTNQQINDKKNLVNENELLRLKITILTG